MKGGYTWKEGVACMASHCKGAVDVSHMGWLRWVGLMGGDGKIGWH